MSKAKEFRIIETSVMDRWKSEHILRYVVQRFTGPPINDYYPVAAFGKESEAKAHKKDLVRKTRARGE